MMIQAQRICLILLMHFFIVPQCMSMQDLFSTNVRAFATEAVVPAFVSSNFPSATGNFMPLTRWQTIAAETSMLNSAHGSDEPYEVAVFRHISTLINPIFQNSLQAHRTPQYPYVCQVATCVSMRLAMEIFYGGLGLQPKSGYIGDVEHFWLEVTFGPQGPAYYWSFVDGQFRIDKDLKSHRRENDFEGFFRLYRERKMDDVLFSEIKGSKEAFYEARGVSPKKVTDATASIDRYMDHDLYAEIRSRLISLIPSLSKYQAPLLIVVEPHFHQALQLVLKLQKYYLGHIEIVKASDGYEGLSKFRQLFRLGRSVTAVIAPSKKLPIITSLQMVKKIHLLDPTIPIVFEGTGIDKDIQDYAQQRSNVYVIPEKSFLYHLKTCIDAILSPVSLFNDRAPNDGPPFQLLHKRFQSLVQQHAVLSSL